jgi:hypothetical protein
LPGLDLGKIETNLRQTAAGGYLQCIRKGSAKFVLFFLRESSYKVGELRFEHQPKEVAANGAILW